MKVVVPPAAAAVFGGRTRAAVLGYLAGSLTPRTGYAVAKALGLGFSKAYGELARLEKVGIVVGRMDSKGARSFSLADDDLRRFLKRAVPIMPSDDWFSPRAEAERQAAFERARSISIPRVLARAHRPAPPAALELRRSPEKDLVLRRMRKRAGRRR